MADSSSRLYRHLRAHPRSGAHLLPEAAADLTHRLATGRETAEDGDELAEVCFRAAGRAGTGSRDEQSALAAALLAHLTGTFAAPGGMTRCGSCLARVRPARWPGAIRCCTHPAVVRTVAR